MSNILFKKVPKKMKKKDRKEIFLEWNETMMKNMEQMLDKVSVMHKISCAENKENNDETRKFIK